MIAAYLNEECELGRVAADADVDALALALIGAGHLLFAGREGVAPQPAEVSEVVTAVIADIVQRRLL